MWGVEQSNRGCVIDVAAMSPTRAYAFILGQPDVFQDSRLALSLGIAHVWGQTGLDLSIATSPANQQPVKGEAA